MSGVAEASFQCIVPPLIQDRCAEEKDLADRRNSIFVREEEGKGVTIDTNAKLASVEEEVRLLPARKFRLYQESNPFTTAPLHQLLLLPLIEALLRHGISGVDERRPELLDIFP